MGDSLSKKSLKVIGYATYGFPDVLTSRRFMEALLEEGFSGIEVGVPFSDPVADGPAIQLAHSVALKNNVSVGDVLKFAAELKEKYPQKEVYVMSYLNPLARAGFRNLPSVDGYIIPDLPICEYSSSKFAFRYIPLISPNSPQEDIDKALEIDSPFVYLISLYGTTGADFPKDLKKLEEIACYVRERGHRVYVGFGVNSHEKARRVNEFADGAVVGTHLLKILAEKGLRKALKEASIIMGK